MITKYLARRRLAKLTRTAKALNADYTARRNAQLTTERKKHIEGLLHG